MKIKLESEDIVELELPNGRIVSIQLSDIDEDVSPELDIWWEGDLTANCYRDHLVSAGVVDCCQIIIPID